VPRWLVFALLTVLLWGGWGFASRRLGSALSAEHNLVLSSLGLIPIVLFLHWTTPLAARQLGRGAGIAAAAGLFGGTGNLLFYGLLSAGEKASTVVPLTALYPVVTLILATTLLGERLRRPQVAGVVLALGAIYLFNVPREGAIAGRWFIAALGPIVLWGIAGLLQKCATSFTSAEAATYWFLLGTAPVVVWVGWHHPVPSWPDRVTLTWALALGLLLGIGNLTVLAAYAHNGLASVITPLSGLYPLVTVPLAILFLGEKVTPRELAGIAVSLVAVLALSWEKTESNKPVPGR
jgi:bacterial/archaeal transporter family protein